jgi:hypothetical protein
MVVRFLAIFLLAFAITGAPFGMGRMMDTAHAAHASQHMSGHHGHDLPTHNADVPHYVACAACAAAIADAAPAIQLMVLQGALEAATANAMTGITSVPLTPPPQA